MSVILDALRKLDRERSSRRSAAANIAVEILRPDLPGPGKKLSLYVATVSLTAIAAVVITYAVVSKFGFLPKSSPTDRKGPPVSTQPIATAPPDSSLLSRSSPPGPTNLPAPAQQQAPVPLGSGFPSKSSLPAPKNPPVPSQQVAPPPPPQEPVRDARDEINRVSPKIQTPAESKTSKIGGPPPGSATTLPSLKLSAIVWYEERSKRFVMVNGLIANEGSVVEGVKVEEIYPDRVRFSHNGRPFEIPIK
jgi:general secretion pathway protein B